MELTLEKIKDWNLNVSETLQKLNGFESPYPKKPSKPILNSKHSTEEVLEYAKKLENYDKEFEQWKFNKSLYDEQDTKLSSLKEEFIKDYVGFYEYVPKDKQDKVWNKAWGDGHSNGWYEVYLHLDELVELFS